MSHNCAQPFETNGLPCLVTRPDDASWKGPSDGYTGTYTAIPCTGIYMGLYRYRPALLIMRCGIADGIAVHGDTLQALQYWLLCSGIPTSIFVLSGHRPSGVAAGKAAKLPVETFQALRELAARISRVPCSAEDLQGLQWRPKAAPRAAVTDSLMYS
jgi:hypothetical protein